MRPGIGQSLSSDFRHVCSTWDVSSIVMLALSWGQGLCQTGVTAQVEGKLNGDFWRALLGSFGLSANFRMLPFLKMLSDNLEFV